MMWIREPIHLSTSSVKYINERKLRGVLLGWALKYHRDRDFSSQFGIIMQFTHARLRITMHNAVLRVERMKRSSLPEL